MKIGAKTMKSEQQIRKQLKEAEKDDKRESSQRTRGYIDALRWVLGLEG
jgi:hypothetical protein